MHDLHPYVAFLVLPLFAFAKAGVSFAGPVAGAGVRAPGAGRRAGPVPRQADRACSARPGWRRPEVGARPTDATWLELYGVSLLCGVGFTMSLFIGALAFPGAVDSPSRSRSSWASSAARCCRRSGAARAGSVVGRRRASNFAPKPDGY